MTQVGGAGVSLPVGRNHYTGALARPGSPSRTLIAPPAAALPRRRPCRPDPMFDIRKLFARASRGPDSAAGHDPDSDYHPSDRQGEGQDGAGA